MKEITVKRADLLARIKTNRDHHRDEFEKALEGYRGRVTAELERRLDDLRHGFRGQVYIALPVPEDHTRDYDRVIAMLDMEIADTVTIQDQEFAWYVMDEWQWKPLWVSSNAAYLSPTD